MLEVSRSLPILTAQQRPICFYVNLTEVLSISIAEEFNFCIIVAVTKGISLWQLIGQSLHASPWTINRVQSGSPILLSSMKADANRTTTELDMHYLQPIFGLITVGPPVKILAHAAQSWLLIGKQTAFRDLDTQSMAVLWHVQIWNKLCCASNAWTL